MVEHDADIPDGAPPEEEVKLTIIAPKPAPTPVGVGAEGGAGQTIDEPEGALDKPAVEEPEDTE
jgi:hypothetical protein